MRFDLSSSLRSLEVTSAEHVLASWHLGIRFGAVSIISPCRRKAHCKRKAQSAKNEAVGGLRTCIEEVHIAIHSPPKQESLMNRRF